METLLEITTDVLPIGHDIVEVDRWTPQPSASAPTLPPHEGVVIITVASSELTPAAAGSEQQLARLDDMPRVAEGADGIVSMPPR